MNHSFPVSRGWEKQVSTASTKSSNRKKKPMSGTNSRGRTETTAADNLRVADISERSWLIGVISILLTGGFLRLYDLSLVPLHHDEGVNGNFLVQLVRDNFYRYNPENYHGPSLYYFAAIIPWTVKFLFGQQAQNAYGLTTFSIRLVPALFGLGTIWLVLMLRRRLGTIGTLAAAAFLAVSPGAVYLSRYFIHESLFVFFTLGIVVAALKYYDSGAGVYLILGAISAALMVATKETWIINGPVLLIALITTTAYFWLRGRASKKSQSTDNDEFLARFGGPVSVATVALVAFTIF